MNNKIEKLKKKIRIELRQNLIKSPLGKRLWQFLKAILLLKQPCFRDLFFEVRRNDICIDFGANIGDASLVMWLKGCKFIYAVEPNLEAFRVLEKNLYNIKNISTLNLAVSSKTKIEKLYLHKSINNKNNKNKILELSQASSLLSDKTNIGECFYEVQAMSIFDLFSKINQTPNIIKCDIEGGEYIIYKQLIKYAKSYKVRKIFVECHAKKYPKYKLMHEAFMNLIKNNKLENVFDTSWH